MQKKSLFGNILKRFFGSGMAIVLIGLASQGALACYRCVSIFSGSSVVHGCGDSMGIAGRVECKTYYNGSGGYCNTYGDICS